MIRRRKKLPDDLDHLTVRLAEVTEERDELRAGSFDHWAAGWQAGFDAALEQDQASYSDEMERDA